MRVLIYQEYILLDHRARGHNNLITLAFALAGDAPSSHHEHKQRGASPRAGAASQLRGCPSRPRRALPCPRAHCPEADGHGCCCINADRQVDSTALAAAAAADASAVPTAVAPAATAAAATAVPTTVAPTVPMPEESNAEHIHGPQSQTVRRAWAPYVWSRLKCVLWLCFNTCLSRAVSAHSS